MKLINKVASYLKAEPVAISTVVASGLTLAEAIQRHALTEGAITSAALALLGLVTRQNVSPVSTDTPTEEQADPAS